MGREWPEYTLERGEYMKLKKGKASVGRKLDEDVCSLFSTGLETMSGRRRRRSSVDQEATRALESFLTRYPL